MLSAMQQPSGVSRTVLSRLLPAAGASATSPCASSRLSAELMVCGGIVPVRADGRLGEAAPAEANHVQEPQSGIRDARASRVGVIELLELLAGAVVGDVKLIR